MTGYFYRDLAPAVFSALEEMPVVVITGLRQTGKTTFLRKQPGLARRRYVTFDEFPQLAAAKSRRKYTSATPVWPATSPDWSDPI